ncbi:MAG: CHASE2 domain-containing protein [Thermodesulfobacteriota bacterium]
MLTFRAKARIRSLWIVLVLSAMSFSLLTWSIVSRGVFANMLSQMDNALYGQMLATSDRLAGKSPAGESDVVLVALDDRALQKLSAYNPETYRRYHVQALAHLVAGKPRAVVYDILFADAHPDPEVDLALAARMKETTSFVAHFAASVDESGGEFDAESYPNLHNVADRAVYEEGFFPMPEPIFRALSGFGLSNAYPDTDGVLRKMPVFVNVGGRMYPTIALEVYRRLHNVSRESVVFRNHHVIVGDRLIPADQDLRTRIPMLDREFSVREISFYDVALGRVPAEYFSGKVVFVAATATGLGDNKLLPVHGYVPGVRVHINLFLGLEKNRLVGEPSTSGYMILLFLAAICYTFLFFNKNEHSLPGKVLIRLSRIPALRRAWTAVVGRVRLDRVAGALSGLARKSYFLRFTVALFEQTRSRLQALLFQLLLLYLAIYWVFLEFSWYVRPTPLLLQVMLSFVFVSEFRRIDAALAGPAGGAEATGQEGKREET